MMARMGGGHLSGTGLDRVHAKSSPAPPVEDQQIHDDLYEIEGDGGNVAVLVTSEGILLVDDKFEYDHDAILGKIKTVSQQPVKYIINTHYHQDHSGGNANSSRRRISSPPRMRAPISWSVTVQRDRLTRRARRESFLRMRLRFFSEARKFARNTSAGATPMAMQWSISLN